METATAKSFKDWSEFRPPARDLRLDLFRGLGLWMVFLDHIPTTS